MSTSGLYVDTLVNANGCDSLVKTEFTLYRNDTTLYQSSCKAELTPWGVLMDSSNTYYDTLRNRWSCDSILSLVFNLVPIDTSIHLGFGTLTSNEKGASNYEWFDCKTDTLTQSGTNPTFAPLENGSYRVIISSRGCVDTSYCKRISNVGLNELTQEAPYLLYPIPSTGTIFLEILGPALGETAIIYDTKGKIVYSKKIKYKKNTLNLKFLATGVYYLQYHENVSKLIIQRP